MFTKRAFPKTAAFARGVASYDSYVRSHSSMVSNFHADVCNQNPFDFSEKSLLPAIEAVEDRISSWRRNRWEFRVPPTLRGSEKINASEKLFRIQLFYENYLKLLLKRSQDKETVALELGVKVSELAGKSRAWVQSECDKLRWDGRISEAKRAREAWIRLERSGARDFQLLERVCAIYNLGSLGTFDDAFGSQVVVDETNVVHIEEGNALRTALATILRGMPTINICQDFIGFGSGYSSSLGEYMTDVLSKSRCVSSFPSSGKILYSHAGEILVDMRDRNANLEESSEAKHLLGDFAFISGTDVTLLVIASPSKHLRNIQIPTRRQLEGIVRRLCLVCALDPKVARARTLLLPPSSLDVQSLNRIHKVLGLNEGVDKLAEKRLVPMWAGLYDYNTVVDKDYEILEKKYPEEEWVKL